MSKNKNKKLNKGRHNLDLLSDNESNNDLTSIYSSGSYDEDNPTNQDDNQLTSAEKFEEKLLQSIENATEKSAETRTHALRTITEALQHRHVPEFIEDRKITIADMIEKSLRKGKNAEQDWAAQLAPLLVIQLGGEDTISSALCQVLFATMQNQSCSYSARAISCSSYCMLHFLDSDVGDIIEVLQQLENIFSNSFLKGDKNSLVVSDAAARLHIAALGGWALLMTLISPGEFSTYIRNTMFSMKNFISLLQSTHLEVRMVCGEIIALIVECSRNYNDDFMDPYIPDLIEITSELAKDSQKFRRKKERKAQRASFREVLRYLEDDIHDDIQIRFGSESLVLSTWSMTIQYEKMCDIIGPGMTIHLAENELLREVFQLGSKVTNLNGVSFQKQSKLERHLLNAAAFKARTLSRKKNRDKRTLTGV